MDNKVFNIEPVERSEHTFEYKASVIGEHPVFKGHFPQAPVVPGVCTVQMIKDCLEDALSRPVRFVRIKECKFLAAILPSGQNALTVMLVLKQDASGDLNVTAEVTSAGTKMMKLKATLAG